jgi:hypothetical protein
MTDFDRMIGMLRNSGVTERNEVIVRPFYDSTLDQHFTDICIGDRPDGGFPDIILSFNEDTQKLATVWP